MSGFSFVPVEKVEVTFKLTQSQQTPVTFILFIDLFGGDGVVGVKKWSANMSV